LTGLSRENVLDEIDAAMPQDIVGCRDKKMNCGSVNSSDRPVNFAPGHFGRECDFLFSGTVDLIARHTPA
jgi:hypothetical protein